MHAMSMRRIVVYGIGVLIGISILIWVILVVRESSGAGLAENNAKVPGADHPEKKEPDPPVRKQPDGQGPAPVFQPQAPVLVAKTPSPQEVERKARAKAKLLDAKNLGREAGAHLDALDKHIAVWETRTKTLLADEAGRKIADSPVAVDQADALMSKTRMAKLAVENLRGRLQALLDPVESALRVEDGSYTPTPELLAEIASIDRTAADGNRNFELDHAILQTLLADHGNRKPGGLTLSEAIEKRRSIAATKEAEELAKAKAKAREIASEKIRQAETEATVKIAEAEAYAAKVLGEVKAKQLKEQADQTKKKLQEIAEAEARKTEQQDLKRRAEDPAIQAKYQALMAPGRFQFNSVQGGSMTQSERPEPVSFGELSRNHWMKDAKSFARALSAKPHIDYNWFNDRPVLAYPKSAADWTKVDRMLEEFRVLGPVWVEMKLLRP